MKNQYFGDINDYRKYGLLRILINGGDIKTAVCWMLTPDDGRTDGGRITYLSQPEKWRDYDPPLYDHLQDLVVQRDVRDVAEIENSDLLPSCTFLSDIVPDDRQARALYFQRLMDLARDCELVFFDPDNGIEVKSKPVGRRDSSKYLYWHEIEDFWKAGHSLLIYQHFPRVKRDPYIKRRARELAQRTGAEEVLSFLTPRVLFLLAPQDDHWEFFRESSEEVAEVWGSQILVARHSPSRPETS